MKWLPCEQRFFLLHGFGVNKATTRQTSHVNDFVNKATTRQTSHVNDFVNTKSHAREKPLLAG